MVAPFILWFGLEVDFIGPATERFFSINFEIILNAECVHVGIRGIVGACVLLEIAEAFLHNELLVSLVRTKKDTVKGIALVVIHTYSRMLVGAHELTAEVLAPS